MYMTQDQAIRSCLHDSKICAMTRWYVPWQLHVTWLTPSYVYDTRSSHICSYLHDILTRNPPPPRFFFDLASSLTKNPEEGDPPGRICTRCLERGPLPPGSWLGNLPNRKPPRGGGVSCDQHDKVICTWLVHMLVTFVCAWLDNMCHDSMICAMTAPCDMAHAIICTWLDHMSSNPSPLHPHVTWLHSRHRTHGTYYRGMSHGNESCHTWTRVGPSRSIV